MDDLHTLLKSKKIRLNLIIISLLILLLPIGILLVRQAQVYFSRAEAKFIEIAEGKCVSLRKGVKVLTCADVPLKLINPFLQPNATPSQSPSGDATDTSYELKALTIKYFPITADNKIDINITGDVGDPYDVVKQRTETITDNLLNFIPKATSYLGYKQSSNPAIKLKIVDTKEFKQSVPIKSRTDRPTYPDYNQILSSNNICGYVNNKDVSEVFIWAYQGPNKPGTNTPYLGIDETKMSGAFGDISNSGRYDDLPKCKKTYRVYTFNYGRGTAEALHTWSHQIEAELDAVNQDIFRNKFQGPNYPQTLGINGRCGSVHNPPNAKNEYDWGNKTAQSSDCMDWKPDGIGALSQISCVNWGCEEESDTNNPQLNYIVWNWQNLPGRNNKKTYQSNKIRNLWDIHGKFDEVMRSDKTFFIGAASPTSSASTSPSPSGGSTTPTPSGGSIGPPRIVRVNGSTGAAIQAALDSIKSTGGAVYVPAGTYTVTAKIRVFSNVTLFGDGIDNTILQLDGSRLTSDEGILANDTSNGQRNIVIRDMTFKGLFQESGIARCCAGLKIRNLDGGFIHNVKVEGFSWFGIWLSFNNGKGVKNVRISNCQMLNNKGAGVSLSSLSEGNVIDNCQFTGNNDSVDRDKAAAAIMVENGILDGPTKNNRVLNNTVTGNFNVGIITEADPSEAEVLSNAICNNIVENNVGVGILDRWGESNIFIANRINNNGDRRDGKLVSEGSTGLIEDESSGATNAACNIPSQLQTIPPAPAKPTSSAENSIWKFLSFKPGTVFAQNNSATSLLPDSYTYRLAESEAELSNAEWKPYITNSSSTSNTPTTSQSINNGTTSKLSYVDSAAGKIVISGVSDIEKPFNGLGLLATLNVKVKDNAPLGPTSIKFDFDPNNLSKTTDSNVVERGTVADVLRVVNNGNYTVGPDKTCPSHSTFWPVIANSSGATLSMATTDLDRGCLNSLLIYLDSGGRNLDGVDAILTYDPDVFEISTSSIQTDNAIFPNYYGGNQVLGESIQSVAITNFTLSDETPGPKQIWVEFQDPTGKTIKDHITFNLAEKDPEITALNCTYDLARQNIKVAISGKRFGQTQGSAAVGTNLKEGDIKAGTNNNIDILNWAPEEITLLFKNGNSVLQSGQSLKVALTREDDGKSPLESCQVDQSSISLGARVFCREPGKFDIDNVKVSIFYNPDDSKSNQKLSKVDETVTISKDGFVQGLKTKLQSGKNYALSIQAPNSLRRNAAFKASDGTTIVSADEGEPFILPIGDIAPVTNPDGQINALDRSEITRQWRILGENKKKLTGDFNRDGRVNSIDWACMRFDFNTEDDPPPSFVPVSQNSSNSENTVITPIEATQ